MSVSSTAASQHYIPPQRPVTSPSTTASGLFSALSGSTVAGSASSSQGQASQHLSENLQAFLVQQQAASGGQGQTASIPADPKSSSQAMPDAVRHHHGHHYKLDGGSPSGSDAAGSNLAATPTTNGTGAVGGATGNSPSGVGSLLVKAMMQAIQAYTTIQPAAGVASVVTGV